MPHGCIADPDYPKSRIHLWASFSAAFAVAVANPRHRGAPPQCLIVLPTGAAAHVLQPGGRCIRWIIRLQIGNVPATGRAGWHPGKAQPVIESQLASLAIEQTIWRRAVRTNCQPMADPGALYADGTVNDHELVKLRQFRKIMEKALQTPYPRTLPARAAALVFSDAPTGTAVRYEFFSNIVRHVIRDHGIVDRRWFIAYNGDVELPPLDRDCVVFVYGDERSLLPWRYHKAGLILKCMGLEPYATENPRPELAWALDRLRIARNRALNARIKAQLGHDQEANLVARVLPFPLGYARQPELPLKPLRDRRHLMWFSGSFLNAGGPPWAVMQRLADEPKFAARRRMVAAVRQIHAVHPDWPIRLDMLNSYADSRIAPDG